ncbi:MAG TPA: AMIN domain-containing protein [Chromatiales bacterium]|nr:AMIN domain-containing protein [Chromatiales bacterium]
MRRLAAFLLLILAFPAWSQTVDISGIRLWNAPDHIRLVFDSSAPLIHTIYGLSKPDRLVIDLKNARLRTSFPRIDGKNTLVKAIRGAKRKGGKLRVVVDLTSAAKPKSFTLKPNKRYGHRLVVDLYPRKGKAKRPAKSVVAVKEKARDVVIAIDAGHGGEDGGARGPHGTHEKDVVLRIARKLAALVRKEPGMKPVMIRNGDYYLGLRKRMERARRARADLFISIHADAFRDRRVRGASVYTLSHRGASSEFARWLARRENSSDLIGGVELADKDDVLRTVLLDLAQNATMQVSADAAREILKEMKNVATLHKSRVQQAGFVVLKSPDIPSVLVETAFISNPKEERNLRDPRYQQKLAKAMMKGIRNYFRRYPPPGTLLAKNAPKRHVIHRGETLSGIAQQYRIGIAKLRRANGLNGDRIRIGQVLHIPES